MDINKIKATAVCALLALLGVGIIWVAVRKDTRPLESYTYFLDKPELTEEQERAASKQAKYNWAKNGIVPTSIAFVDTLVMAVLCVYSKKHKDELTVKQHLKLLGVIAVLFLVLGAMIAWFVQISLLSFT